MSARRRKHDDHEEEHENEERWLVSFADMMTLLFALFMVLFSISSVNVSKLQVLQRSLQEAFSGKVLSGGKAIMETGNDADPSTRAAATPPLAALQPASAVSASSDTTSKDSGQSAAAAAQAAKAEEASLEDLKRKIDGLAKQRGLDTRVKTVVTAQGLVIQILTDKVFFDSGSAAVKPQAEPILTGIAHVLNAEQEHPIEVSGHTDSQPIHSGQYPSNWELSTARASAVVRDFIHTGVLQRRLTAMGRADEDPTATNKTLAGRAKNRRVDVVLPRLHSTTP